MNRFAKKFMKGKKTCFFLMAVLLVITTIPQSFLLCPLLRQRIRQPLRMQKAVEDKSTGYGYAVIKTDMATDLNPAGIVYKVYTDASLSDKTEKFVLSYDGKAYIDASGRDVFYKKSDEVPANPPHKVCKASAWHLLHKDG